MEALKRLFLFTFAIILMSNCVSAFEFDNVGSYDYETKTITITNAFGLGDKIGGAKLNTPQVNRVSMGYQKVAEFDLWAKQDYNDVLKNLEFYDKNHQDWENKKFSRSYDIKYKTYKNVSVEEWENVFVGYYEDGTAIYEGQVTGNHIEEKESWIKVTPADLKKNDNLTIGIFTNVEKGDKVEWIISIYGVAVKEWAVWTQSLNVGLVSCYKLDEGSGTVIDSLGLYNGTNTGAVNTTGIILSAYDFESGDSGDNINLGDNAAQEPTNALSFSMWIKPESLANNMALLDKGDGVTAWNVQTRVAGTDFRFLINNAGVQTVGTPLSTGVFQHISGTWDGTNVRLYHNGNNKGNGTSATLTQNANSLRMGSIHSGGANFYDGVIDEVMIWNRTLNLSEIRSLTNGGLGLSCIPDLIDITVTLNLPENNSIQSSTLVSFNYTIAPTSSNITNWTLTVNYENGTLAHQHINTSININDTVTIIHNDTLFFDETYVWNVEACGTDGVDDVCDLSENRTFTIDTIPPVVNITYPPENFIVTQPQENITVNYTVIHDGTPDSCYLNTSFNSTEIIINCSANTTALNYPISAPENLTIFLYSNDTAGNVGSDNVTIFKDSTGPTINITAPIGTLIFTENGENETLNWTVNDTNLETCWYDYNGTNITVNCSLNTTNFIFEQGNTNITFYANDTLGNINSDFQSWDYLFEQYNLTYDSTIFEGVSNTFTADIILGGGNSISQAIFSYNATNYTTSITFASGEYEISSTLNSPIVNEDTNISVTFYFVIDGTTYNPVEETQLVFNTNLTSICTNQSSVLLNMSLFNEETREGILGDIQVDSQLISKQTLEEVESINISFENVSSGQLCLNPISSKEFYYMDTEIRYTSTNFAPEFYYIQRANLSLYPINLSLFDLSLNDSTEFLVTYSSDNLIIVEGAIIQLQRKYIADGAYEVVEAPLTSNLGEAVVHIDLNTNKYRATIVKDGETLDFFDNLVFNCENELAGQCSQELFGRIDPQNSADVITLNDFSAAVSESNNTITTSFSIPSGTPSNINILLEQTDVFGDTFLCNQTITSSAGSIDCSFNDTMDDSIINLEIRKDGELAETRSYIIYDDGDLDFDGNNWFILFILAISIIAMAFSSPEWIVINAVVVLIFSAAVWLSKGTNIVIGLGNLLWIIVAAGLLIKEMAKQEDR